MSLLLSVLGCLFVSVRPSVFVGTCSAVCAFVFLLCKGVKKSDAYMENAYGYVLQLPNVAQGKVAVASTTQWSEQGTYKTAHLVDGKMKTRCAFILYKCVTRGRMKRCTLYLARQALGVFSIRIQVIRGQTK